MCKKQATVSHSSVESEIRQSDVGRRMGRAHQQHHCGMVCWTHFHFLTPGESLSAPSGVRHPHFIEHMSCEVKIPQEFMSSQVVHFRDDETAIRVIIQGRSPNLTHESRTHPVHLDWLFEQINLDSSSSIRHVRTGEELA